MALSSGSRRSRSSPFADIPQEIIIDILSWMPVKTLSRFKCVCKLWKSIISDADFIKKHLDRMSSMDNNLSHHRLLFTNYDLLNPFIFIDDGSIQLQAVSMNSLLSSRNSNPVFNPTMFVLESDGTKFDMVEPIGSCNGLVLLFIPTAKKLLLSNLSIREIKVLPNSGRKMRHRMFNKFGFGYDRLSNDYKVVEICPRCHCCLSQEDQVWLYSLKANSWRRIKYTSHNHPRPAGLVLARSPSLKHVGDKLVWSTYRTFVSLDLIEETIQEFSLPIDVDYYESRGRYGVLAGKLCLIISFHSHIEIWAMMEIGVKESWSKLFTFPNLKEVDGGYMAAEPLYLTEHNEVVVKCEEEIAVYSNIDGDLKRMVLLPSNVHSPQIYVESLVSPNVHADR